MLRNQTLYQTADDTQRRQGKHVSTSSASRSVGRSRPGRIHTTDWGVSNNGRHPQKTSCGLTGSRRGSHT